MLHLICKMKKSERANIVIKILDKFYPETPIPLNHNSVYTLLIAVLLSAQCTDERVNKITPKLFSVASDPKSMSKLTIDSIYKIIKPFVYFHNHTKNDIDKLFEEPQKIISLARFKANEERRKFISSDNSNKPEMQKNYEGIYRWGFEMPFSQNHPRMPYRFTYVLLTVYLGSDRNG